jgi:hypothetical protein
MDVKDEIEMAGSLSDADKCIWAGISIDFI